MHAVAAGILCRIAGRVGTTQRVLQIAETPRLRYGPNVRADSELFAAAGEAKIPHPFAQSLGDLDAALDRAVGENHAELVAAQARQGIGAAQTLLQQPGDLAQQGVTGGMAADIVDQLELVEIDVAEQVPGGTRIETVDQRTQRRLEFSAIDRPGQAIMLGLVRQLALHGPCLGYVVEDHYYAGHVTAAVADRRSGMLYRMHIAVMAIQQAGFRVDDRLPLAQHALHHPVARPLSR